MIKRFIGNERSKRTFVIGVVAIGTGFTAKNVITYPSEFIKEEVAHDFVSPERARKNFIISWPLFPQKDQKGINFK